MSKTSLTWKPLGPGEYPALKPNPANLEAETSAWPFINDLENESRNALKATREALDQWQEVDQLLVIGIGGSALGARTISDALGGGEIFFLENADPFWVETLLKDLDLERLGIHIVSKSGTTTETLLNTHRVLDILTQQKIKDFGKRLIVTSDPDPEGKNPLVALANHVGGQLLPLNPAVGGRFCAFTTAVLLPLLYGGHSGRGFHKGGLRALTDCREGFWDAWFGRVLGQWQAGYDTLVFMPYGDLFDSLGQWMVQLLSESLGKHKADGSGERIGLTPVAALGTRDQHSYLQLIQDGPRNKQVMLLGASELFVDSKRPFKANRIWPEFPKRFYGHTLQSVQQLQMRATAQALSEDGIPVDQFNLEVLTPFSLGYFLSLCMVLTATLADAQGINAFDQPGVEMSKKLTEKALENLISKKI